MEKVIWVFGDARKDMLEAQRRINSTGSMRAFSLMSLAALERAIQNCQENQGSRISSPSLIIIDYGAAVKEKFISLSMLKNQQFLAGVPIFFMTDKKSQELEEECFELGAMVVLQKPFSKAGVLRIERMAWQHEVTKNYEKMLQRQASDLQAAREIMRLNQQLEARNELLYQVFGRYFSDEVLEVILEQPEDAAIGGEKRELTVMMSDLRGFTSLSEELESEAVTKLLNFFFEKMVEVISHYHGTIIEFLGDGVLAVFGAPLYVTEPVAAAVAAAINMQNCMMEVNTYCEEHGYPRLEMGIGIHHGEAFIGNVGSEKMMRYNVIGRVVNECSRIESYSVGGQVLVSKAALATISCPTDILNQMEIMAKGIQKPISLCEVIGIGGEYQSYIENDKAIRKTEIQETIVFKLYLIEEKMVDRKPFLAVLKQFSEKQAIINLENNEIELYADVEIIAENSEGAEIFSGVYAKVVGRNEKELLLHFTHINQKFKKYIESLFREV